MLQYQAQSDSGRSTVHFATKTFSRHLEARLWRGTQKSVARLFLCLDQTWRPAMQKGTVKWFNPTKGYGFIKPAVGDKDVFVHISAVERAGLSTLNENQVVEYDLVENAARRPRRTSRFPKLPHDGDKPSLCTPRLTPGIILVKSAPAQSRHHREQRLPSSCRDRPPAARHRRPPA